MLHFPEQTIGESTERIEELVDLGIDFFDEDIILADQLGKEEEINLNLPVTEHAQVKI